MLGFYCIKKLNIFSKLQVESRKSTAKKCNTSPVDVVKCANITATEIMLEINLFFFLLRQKHNSL